jgi:CRISPR-associated protein Cmr1
MAWTTLTLQVTTPLFNGGADPEGKLFASAQEPGVRVASIRGAMRFWFRALAGGLTGPNLRLLAGMERKVFGGITGSSHDEPSATPSPLLLRIPDPPPVVLPTAQSSFLPSRSLPRNERRRHESKWILYLMGQGLADLSKVKLKRPYVEPKESQTFHLKVGFRHAQADNRELREAIEALALTSLWLTCTYGGIGARTRKGFGGVSIIAAEGTEALPEPWKDPSNLLTPGLAYYEGLRSLWPSSGPIASCMRYVLSVLAAGHGLNPRTAWTGTAPSFPVLSPASTPAATSQRDFRDWAETLIYAGEEFRRFRADTYNSNPKAQYHPRYETHEWPETIHGDDRTFALGALGLPVVYNDDYIVNVDCLDTSEPLRRASPLWLRPVGNGNRWRLLSFAFQTRFLPGPNAPAVHLWDHGERSDQLEVTDDDLKRQTLRWITAMNKGETFTVEHRR